MFEEFEKRENVDLKNLNTMKVGGVGKYLLFPKNIDEIRKITKICEKNKIKMLVLGNGSNILFPEYFDGALISLKHFAEVKTLKSELSGKRFNFVKKNGIKKRIETIETIEENSEIKIEKTEKTILDKKVKNTKNTQNIKNAKKFLKNREKTAKKPIFFEIGAGINLFELNLKLKNFGASGMEFCYGIPATLGGFVFMNGGCFGHEVGEFVEEVTALVDGEIAHFQKDEILFCYRYTKFQEIKNCIILSVKMRFFAQKSEKIEKSMNFYFQQKRNLQPCNLPSLGSVFKKKDGISAAQIIDQLGLKGLTLGGAQVSTKHAGFVVNTGNATSKDVKTLVHILQLVLASCGHNFCPEIVILE